MSVRPVVVEGMLLQHASNVKPNYINFSKCLLSIPNNVKLIKST